jgi:hypothetical protein
MVLWFITPCSSKRALSSKSPASHRSGLDSIPRHVMRDLWWTKCTGAEFLRVLRFPFPILIPPNAPYSSVIRGWYNKSISVQCTKWTEFYPTPLIIKNIYLNVALSPNYTALQPTRAIGFILTAEILTDK